MFKKRKNNLAFYDDITSLGLEPNQNLRSREDIENANLQFQRETSELKKTYEARINNLNERINRLKNEPAGDKIELENKITQLTKEKEDALRMYNDRTDTIRKLDDDVKKQNNEIIEFKRGKLEMENESSKQKLAMQEIKEEYIKKNKVISEELDRLKYRYDLIVQSGNRNEIDVATKKIEDHYKKALDLNKKNLDAIYEDNKKIKEELNSIQKLYNEKESAYKILYNELEKTKLLQSQAIDELHRTYFEKQDKTSEKYVKQQGIIDDLKINEGALKAQILLLEKETQDLKKNNEDSYNEKIEIQNKLDYLKKSFNETITEKKNLENDMESYNKNRELIQQKDDEIKNLARTTQELQNKLMSMEVEANRVLSYNKEILDSNQGLMVKINQKQDIENHMQMLMLELDQKKAEIANLTNTNTRLSESLNRVNAIADLSEQDKYDLSTKIITNEKILSATIEDLFSMKALLDADLSKETNQVKKEVIVSYLQTIEKQLLLLKNSAPITTQNIEIEDMKMEVENQLDVNMNKFQNESSAILEQANELRENYIQEMPNQDNFYLDIDHLLEQYLKKIESLLNDKNHYLYQVKALRNAYIKAKFKNSDFLLNFKLTVGVDASIKNYYQDITRKTTKIQDFEGKKLEISSLLKNIWIVMGLNIVILYSECKRNEAYYGTIAIDQEEFFHDVFRDIRNKFSALKNDTYKNIADMKQAYNVSNAGNIVAELTAKKPIANVSNDIEFQSRNETLQKIVINARKIKNIDDFRFIHLTFNWLFLSISPCFQTKYKISNSPTTTLMPYFGFFLYFNPGWALTRSGTNQSIVQLSFTRNFKQMSKEYDIGVQCFPNTYQGLLNTKTSAIKNMIKSIEFFSKIYLYYYNNGLDTDSFDISIDPGYFYILDKAFWNFFHFTKTEESVPSFYYGKKGNIVITTNENILISVDQITNQEALSNTVFYAYNIMINLYIFLISIDSIGLSVLSDPMYSELETFIVAKYNSLNSGSEIKKFTFDVLKMLKKLIFAARFVTYLPAKILNDKKLISGSFNIISFTNSTWTWKNKITLAYEDVFLKKYAKANLGGLKTAIDKASAAKMWDPYIGAPIGMHLIQQYISEGNVNLNSLMNAFPLNVFDSMALTTSLIFGGSDVEKIIDMEIQMSRLLQIPIAPLLDSNIDLGAAQLYIRNGLVMDEYPYIYTFKAESESQIKERAIYLGVAFLVARTKVFMSSSLDGELSVLEEMYDEIGDEYYYEDEDIQEDEEYQPKEVFEDANDEENKE